MNYKDIIQLLATHPMLKDVARWMDSNTQSLHLGGLHASGKSMMLSTIQQTTGMKMLVVAEDAETAAYLYNDINRAMTIGKCGLLPSSYKKSPKHGGLDLASEIMRTDALNIMHNAKCTMHNYPTSPTSLKSPTTTNSQLSTLNSQLNNG